MPIQRTSAVPVKVQNAITQASRRTSASFDYLVNTARRESSFKTNAKSSSSSAAGLFQFVEGTWLKVVKEDGDRLGLSNIAKNIHKTSSGKYYVPNSGQRRKILALRHDPETSALVAAAYTEHNERYVRGRIGRTPSDGELYLAHFLGPGSAAKMIQLAERQPNSPANRYFPAAAKSNKSIFYKNGKPRSLEQVHKILISSHVDGQNTSIRRSGSGSFSFGIMGDIMTDVSSAGASYGKGESGSIGVWGDIAGSSSSQGEAAATSSKRSGGSKKTASAQTSQAERHRHAAEQYRSASKTTSASPTNNAKWIDDAFGG
jgi:Transglycosylase SLT domain